MTHVKSLNTTTRPELTIQWVWASETVSKPRITLRLCVGPGFSPDR
jgi:hypothetical protein